MAVDGGLIDRDHQVLIAIINEFSDIAVAPVAGDRLRRTLLGLDNYAKRHFAREEELQRAIGFPDRDSHHREHLRLVARLTHFRSELDGMKAAELAAAHERMTGFLHHWIIDHVIKSDLRMRPFAAKLNGASDMAHLQEPANLAGLSVLIVDDEPFMQDTLKAVLRAIDRSLGVTTAGDGETALRRIGEVRPDVVLCDVNMHPLDGLEMVTRLRGHTDRELRDTAVIMLTGDSGDTTIQSATRLDIRGYLLKPVSPNQLGDRLNAIFRDRQPGAAAAALG
jgi:hemerythrin